MAQGMSPLAKGRTGVLLAYRVNEAIAREPHVDHKIAEAAECEVGVAAFHHKFGHAAQVGQGHVQVDIFRVAPRHVLKYVQPAHKHELNLSGAQ
jgi:hypothetical protein